MLMLAQCRETIDRVNREMLALFEERMRAAEGIAAYKAANRLPILDPAREREILAEAAANVPPALAGYARAYFASLMEISRAYQSRLIAGEGRISEELKRAVRPSLFPSHAKVACQGVEGAYSQIACDKLFGNERLLYFRSFEGVFSSVESGLSDYGVLPIENSTHGSVSEVYDLMRRYSCRIVRSMKLKVDHALLAPAGVSLSDIREVRSHSQAIGQCSRFFDAHPEIRAVPALNTAAAAREIAEGDARDVAVIASPACARLYGLSRIDCELQNNGSNFTRFICIAKQTEIYPGARRMSFMLTLPHTQGSLYAVLAKPALAGLNLLKLESRPIEGSDFEVRFYLDLEVPDIDTALSLLDDLEAAVPDLAFLGYYPEV